MKNILIFSNPFGFGPSGKALSIAKEISSHNKKDCIYICGGRHLKSVVGESYRFINLDERNEKDIFKKISKISGEKYIISSQNRFAIKVAKENNIPCAFLDGLSWFWKKIPDDHYFADIIFWINYPNVKNKIPKEFKEKIYIIPGITPDKNEDIKIGKRDGVVFYIGGCKNPLTDLPKNYLRLLDKLFELFFISNNTKITIASDPASLDYFKKNKFSISKMINVYKHEEFINQLASCRKFITNGGQTAIMESFNLKTPIDFFLPINLSQLSLINKISKVNKVSWGKYITIPKNINNFSEREAILLFDKKAKSIINNKLLFAKLFKDFSLIILDKKFNKKFNFLAKIRTGGDRKIYQILSNKWGI